MKTQVKPTIWQFISLEWRLLLQSRQRFLLPLGFFLLVMTLFPLAIDPKAQNLISLSPAIILITVLLSTVLSLERLFQDDYNSGLLHQMYLCRFAFSVLIGLKILLHWLALGLILSLASVLFALMLGLPFFVLDNIALCVLLGTFCCTFIGAITSALTLNVDKAGVLLQLLVLPLLIPILIFTAAMIDFALNQQDTSGLAALCLAYALLSAVLSPLTCSTIIKWQLD